MYAHYSHTSFKVCISCNGGTRLLELKNAIDFIILYYKRGICRSQCFVLNGLSCTVLITDVTTDISLLSQSLNFKMKTNSVGTIYLNMLRNRKMRLVIKIFTYSLNMAYSIMRVQHFILDINLE
jgi:hypothetical protein